MNKDLIGIRVISAIIAIMMIFIFVDVGEGCKSLSEMHYGYSSYLDGLINQTKGIVIAELIFAIVTTILVIVTFAVSFRSYSFDALPSNRLCITICSIVVQKLVAVFQTLALAEYIAGQKISLPGETVVCIIFLFLSLLALIISIACKVYDSDKGSAGFTLAAALILLIVIIISLVSSKESTTMATVYSVFFIIMCLGLIVFESILLFDGTSYYHYSPVNKSHSSYSSKSYDFINTNNGVKKESVITSQPVQSASEPSKKETFDDPTEALKKLKNLLDEGIITEEEYKEKRKKYIDKL